MLNEYLHTRLPMRRSRNFFQEGQYCPGQTARKKSGQRSLVLDLFCNLHRASNGFITEETILSKDPEEVHSNIVQVGGPTFSRGVQMLIFIETHITCDFPGWGPDPLSTPLDPHLLPVILIIFPDKQISPHISACVF